jgi:hypothetical protein
MLVSCLVHSSTMKQMEMFSSETSIPFWLTTVSSQKIVHIKYYNVCGFPSARNSYRSLMIPWSPVGEYLFLNYHFRVGWEWIPKYCWWSTVSSQWQMRQVRHVVEIKIARVYSSTGRKPALVPLCLPLAPHTLILGWTQDDVAWNLQLTVSAICPPPLRGGGGHVLP